MIYLVVTEWRAASEGDSFEREHERDAPHAESALRQERSHNATREATMAEDGFAWRIVRWKRKGERSWTRAR